MERKMFDTPVLPRLATILAEVKSGDLVIPAFQRPFVWDDDRRLNLLDSVAQGMPIGSLLVWRTSQRDLGTYPKVGGIRIDSAARTDLKINYLLDGHQRISTLFGALHPGPREPDDSDEARWPLYYDLGADERPAFRLAPRRGTVRPDWLPLHIMLDGDALFDFTQQLRQQGNREMARKAENLANIFRDYIIPIVPLVTDDLDTVTDAFVRINNQGKAMTEAHMLRALTHLQAIDTEKSFTEVRSRLESYGWGGVDDQVLVNVLKAILGLNVYNSDVRLVRRRLNEDAGALATFGGAIEEAAEALVDLGVRGPAALPYAYQLVTIAAIAAREPGRLSQLGVRDRLKRWFWATTYAEHFTGITGGGIREGIEDLDHVLSGAVPPPVSVEAEEPARPFDGTDTEALIKVSVVRRRAFLLFLAQLPNDPNACKRRQELLAGGERSAVPKLFSKVSSEDLANRVIADADELKELRAALSATGPTPQQCEEFGIPEEASKQLPNREAFLLARRRWLVAKEREFIESVAKGS